MAKAISSATDFLSAIAGKTKLFEVEGATIELRALEWAEVEQLNVQYSGKPVEMTFQVALLGIKSPELNAEQLTMFRKAIPGAIQDISSEIMKMSGMVKDENRPLAGTGSPALLEMAAPK